eukprot:4177503-Pyramimonas_sp.AAC.1
MVGEWPIDTATAIAQFQESRPQLQFDKIQGEILSSQTPAYSDQGVKRRLGASTTQARRLVGSHSHRGA